MSNLSVSQWHAWASGLETPEAWLAWFKNPTQPIDETKAAAAKVPPLMRRRLSALGRAAIESVMAIYDDNDRETHTPVLFASRWGDIGLSIKLLQELCAHEGLSPMGFSTSVHNGIGGLFSISQKHRGNIEAIAAIGTTVSATFFEAMGLLNEGAESVIAVFYEERSPKEFARFHPANFTYAWAVRLKRASDNDVHLTFSSETTTEHPIDTTATLEGLRFLVDPSIKTWTDQGSPTSYRWTKS